MRIFKLLGKVESKKLFAYWDRDQIKFSIDGIDIGVYDPKIMREPILFMDNSLANELSAEAKDKIEAFARNVKVGEIQEFSKNYSKKAKSKIAEAAGIEEDKLIGITEIDLDEKVKPKEVEQQSKKKKSDKSEEKENKRLTTEDVNIKETVELNVMATDMKTIGQVLQRAGEMPDVEGKKFKRLGIVESNDIKLEGGDKNTTRFSVVAIATDGTVVPMNLQQDYQEGSSPREINYQKKANDQIEQDDVLSRFRIGNTGETIAISKAENSGEVEVFYSPGKTRGALGVEGNKSVDQQLETSSVYWKTDIEMRQSEYKGMYHVDKEQKEAEVESKTDRPQLKRGEKGVVKGVEYEDIDGDRNTKSHKHENKNVEPGKEDMSNFNIVIKKMTDEIIEKNPDIGEVFSTGEVEGRVRKFAMKADENEGIEDVIEKATADLEMDAQRFLGRNR